MRDILKLAPITKKTFGIIAPSAPCHPQLLTDSLSYLDNTGCKYKVALSPSSAYGKKDFMFSSDSPRARAKALEALFSDREVEAILSVRGGYGSMEILSEIDYSIIAQNPKPLVGISDVTALMSALYTKCALPCVHGPSLMQSSGGAKENKSAEHNAQVLLRFLSEPEFNPFAEVHLKLLSGPALDCQAPIFGGNLGTLCSLIATPWEANLNEHILFIEETNEAPYKIHRMLLQLKLAGKLNGLKGILLGSFTNCSHANKLGPSLEDVFSDIFHKSNFPVYGYINAGHDSLNFPILLGGQLTIERQRIVKHGLI